MLPRPKKRFGQHFLTDRHYLDRIVAAIAPQARRGDGRDRPRDRARSPQRSAAGGAAAARGRDRPRSRRGAARARSRPTRSWCTRATRSSSTSPALAEPAFASSATCPTTCRRRSSSAWRASPRASATASSCCRRRWSSAWWPTPGTPDYGRLSVMLQYRFAMALALRVPPGAFTPPPEGRFRRRAHGAARATTRLAARDEALFATDRDGGLLAAPQDASQRAARAGRRGGLRARPASIPRCAARRSRSRSSWRSPMPRQSGVPSAFWMNSIL